MDNNKKKVQDSKGHDLLLSECGFSCSMLHKTGIRRTLKVAWTVYSPKNTERSYLSNVSSGWPGVSSWMDAACLILISVLFQWCCKNTINLYHYRFGYYSDVIIRFLWLCKQVYCVQGKGISRVRLKREESITSKKETMLFQEMKWYFNYFAIILFIAF